jgi:putative oxidoreductase
MKAVTLVARVVLGLIYTVFSLAFFFNLLPQGEHSEAATQFMMGLFAAGYVMPLVKTLELVCGIALLAGKFVSLAAVIIFPVTLNIVLFHLFLEPQGLLITVVMLAANVFLFYANRERYSQLLVLKA